MAVARRPLHRIAHTECAFGAANWSDCDKATDNVKADWDAMQQVLLAYTVAVRPGRQEGYRGKSLFDQLVRYIRGQQVDMTNDDGNANVSPWALRLRAAIERFKAGDLPGYNLYTIPGAPVPAEATEVGMPYINGRRVSNDEWTRINGSITQLHTGPTGENPAGVPEVDAELGAPKSKRKGRAGGNRSQRSETAAKSAIADALGVATDSALLGDIDVTGLDA